jgi:glycosyltransferase involved in cell wall biosynthesis
MKPLVSIIIPTYNRAKTVARTINSVLLQTYENFEIVIVEDGSKDETVSLLKNFTDKRISVVYHEINKGVTAAKNTGLNNMRGEWFAILDSDDEIIPEAVEIMMNIPLEKDVTINAVSCNCIDTATGELSGKGLLSDQYVDLETLILQCTGEFWGLTKTELLLSDRFNERLDGYESTLWMKINERAKRFYVHKGLRIFHTEGDDRISKIPKSAEKLSNHYRVLSEERQYLEIVKKYLPGSFAKDCLHAIVYLMASNEKEQARFYYDELKRLKGYRLYKVISFFGFHSNAFLMKKSIKYLTKIKTVN